eukprot:gene4724-860_t
MVKIATCWVGDISQKEIIMASGFWQTCTDAGACVDIKEDRKVKGKVVLEIQDVKTEFPMADCFDASVWHTPHRAPAAPPATLHPA